MAREARELGWKGNVATIAIRIGMPKAGTSFECESVGEAESDETGDKFDLSITMPGCHMLATRKTDGQKFIVGWTELLEAIESIEDYMVTPLEE